jgi:4-amino-4-deoxy-L-arabinose transferase-like glycosyltransferase
MITLRQAVAGLALVVGASIVLATLGRLVLHERRAGAWPAEPAARTGSWMDGIGGPVLLLLITLAGAWLRVFEIDLKTLTHTEGMLPNLAWPPFAWPPPRHSFYDTFWWHYHSELHPPAHYLMLWGWTKAFGTSLVSLRLPSALFGVGSILVSYRIGTFLHHRTVGLLAAAFVAFNGFHIFNSQYARVYMMVTFLALLSTLALLHVMRGGQYRRRWEATYVLSAWLAIYTQSLFWIVLAIQIAWIAIQMGRTAPLIRRVLGLQALVVMLGSAALAHQIYQGATTGYPGPSPGFVIDYLLLGFAFQPDVLSIPQRSLPPVVYWSFAALAILLVGVGTVASTRASAGPIPTDSEGDAAPGRTSIRDGFDLPRGTMLTVAIGSTLVTLGFVILALQRRTEMALTVLVPVLALGLPYLYGSVRSRLPRLAAARRLRPLAIALSRPGWLITLLAFLPTIALVLLAFRASVLNERGLQIFASYVLILAAAGTWVVGRSRLVGVPLALSLIALHVGSFTHWRHYPNESRDYRTLAEQMNERMQPRDLVFVVPRENAITPLYYYLDGWGYTYVPGDYAEAVAANPEAGVWLVFFESYGWGPFRTTSHEMLDALAGFELETQVEALRARAKLYRRAAD